MRLPSSQVTLNGQPIVATVDFSRSLPRPAAFGPVTHSYHLRQFLQPDQLEELDALVLCGLFRDARMRFDMESHDTIMIRTKLIVPDRDTGEPEPFSVHKSFRIDALGLLGPAESARRVLKLLADHEVDEGIALNRRGHLFRPFDPHGQP